MDSSKILVFDVETTGTDKQKDQVIELCTQFGLGSDAPSKTWRIRPEVAMNPEAQAVHGISPVDLAYSPLFAELADEIRALFVDAEMLVGYNLRFDIDMLQAEYMRLRQTPLDLTGKLIVDPYRLWQNSEPRSLMDAHRRFVGGEFEAAHSASADVAATGRVLLGMLSHFKLPSDWNAVADICEPERAFWIGGSGHVRFSEEGEVVFGFGKHRGIKLTDMAAGPDDGYLKWLVGKDFPPHVIALCSAALTLGTEEFAEFVKQRYLSPGAESEQTPAKEPAAIESGGSESATVLVAKPEPKPSEPKPTEPKSTEDTEPKPSEPKPTEPKSTEEPEPIAESRAAQQMLFDL